MAYLIPSFVSAPYFNYLYARENGFLAWLLFGEVVATVKSFAWPYFAWERFTGSSPSDDTTLAEKGDAEAQNKLGFVYDTGQGVGQDYAEAVKWYRKAADHGSALAQFNLAICYGSGQGLPLDFVQASKWFNLAAAGFSASDAELRAKAIKARDLMASKMTPDQIAEALALARKWKAK
jgi:TPR repeat protein